MRKVYYCLGFDSRIGLPMLRSFLNFGLTRFNTIKISFLKAGGDMVFPNVFYHIASVFMSKIVDLDGCDGTWNSDVGSVNPKKYIKI